ncbi:MAG: hypothetical protein U0V48_13795 [Anaerolineales bacterium]
MRPCHVLDESAAGGVFDVSEQVGVICPLMISSPNVTRGEVEERCVV